MKTQDSIQITDIFPSYNPNNSLRRGLNRQDKFLFDRQSVPLHCPVCGGLHTVNELTLEDMQCKGVQLTESIGMFGGISTLSKKE